MSTKRSKKTTAKKKTRTVKKTARRGAAPAGKTRRQGDKETGKKPAKRTTTPRKKKPPTDPDLLLADGLTGRQAAFVQHYLGQAKLNATEAAKLAGYAGDRHALQVEGSRLLLNAVVQQRIRQRLAALGADQQQMLRRIGVLAGASMADLLDLDGAGGVKLNLMKGAAAGALENLKEYTETEDADGNITRKVKINDPAKYVEILAKHLGIIGGDGVNITMNQGGEAERHWSDQELIDYYREQGWKLPDEVRAKKGKAT